MTEAGANYGPGPWNADLDTIPETYLNGRGDFVVGVGGVHELDQGRCIIRRMRIVPEMQRCGLGQKIYDRLEESARRIGYRGIVLDTQNREYQKKVIVEPIVPRNAVHFCRDGWAMIQFDIASDGSTKNIEILESSDRMFNKPSIKAVQQWIFEPSLKNSEPVEPQGVAHKLTFRIDPSACH